MTREAAVSPIGGVQIDIDSVEKVFGLGTARASRALKPLSLSISPGEFVAVVGPSGCGKSTLLLMTAGLLEPTRGHIRIAGAELAGPVTDVGIVFQDHLLLEFRTAIDNVLLQGQVRRRDTGRIGRRAEELFRSLALETAARKYPGQLSGGMRQRVSLARALVHDPSLLMMDEPFGALDALTRLQVRRDLELLWLQRKPTVLFITHSVDEAVGLADRVIVMGPSPGSIVDEIHVDLPRPRPLTLGDEPEMARYSRRILEHFARLGVLH